MTLSKKILAVVVTVLGLYFAELAGGPIARAVFGLPVGFHEHFTSPDSYRQALLVQGASVCIGFLALGTVLGRKISKVRLGQVAWVSNPVTVGFGFLAYKWSWHHLADFSAEYDGVFNFLVFVTVAPLVCALCLHAGEYMRNAAKQKRSGG
jgi:hypothetical protein